MSLHELNKKREERRSSLRSRLIFADIRALLFAPFHASLTVEAALVLPLFLFCMIAVLEYCCAMEAAVKYGTALSETGKEMASTAYLLSYTGEMTSSLLKDGFSVTYALEKVKEKAGKNPSVKNTSMAYSLLLQEKDMIDLVLTYEIKSPVSLISLPGTSFVQRANVRAWTGRDTGDSEESEDEGGQMVLVTETGSVYHTDPACTHLKLSIRTESLAAVESLRNSNGARYHPCEKCGDSCGSTVYITNEGNRYHSSAGCSGLKRTVTQVPLSEVGDMRICSRCGKAA